MRIKKIKALLVMPGLEVQKIKIPANMKFIKAYLGGALYKYKIDDNTIIIGNRDCSQNDFNRFINGNIVIGPFIVVSIKKNRRVSMRKKDIKKYTNYFKLSKHQKKVNALKEEYLEEHYYNQHLNRIKNIKHNRKVIFKKAA